MCSRCRRKSLLESLAPYRAARGVNKDGGRHTRAHGPTADHPVDHIQSVLGEDECKRLIKQAYEDIKNENRGQR